jgi:predicted nucleic acid-binding Zn ribbon protein
MHCGICKRELAKDEAVFRVLGLASRWRDEWGGKDIASVCTQCRAAPPKGSEYLFDPEYGWSTRGHWRAPRPCQHCGRPVYIDTRRDHIRYFVCSDQCRIAIYNANSRHKLKQRREHRSPPKQPCVICGEPFTPKRTDAIYCSAACKQRGYRRKQTQRVGGPAL